MINYKYLFWLTFISFIVLFLYSYIRKEQFESGISQKNWRINDYQFDIRMIDQLLFNSDKSKRQIDSILIDFDQSDGDYFKIKKDTVFLNSTYLLFKENQLKSIQNIYSNE